MPWLGHKTTETTRDRSEQRDGCTTANTVITTTGTIAKTARTAVGWRSDTKGIATSTVSNEESRGIIGIGVITTNNMRSTSNTRQSRKASAKAAQQRRP